MRIAVVTGNPKPASRTHGVALAVADALATELTPASDPGAPARGLYVTESEFGNLDAAVA